MIAAMINFTEILDLNVKIQKRCFGRNIFSFDGSSSFFSWGDGA